MSCSLDNFRQEFPELKGNRLNITNNPKQTQILQWVDSANAQAKSQGFGQDLFTVEYTDRKALTGHTYRRDNVITQTIVHINPNIHSQYEEFIYRDLIPQLQNEQNIDEFLRDSFEQDNILSEEALQVQNEELNYPDVLFSSMPYDFSDDTGIVDDPVTFREWKETRLNLLENLSKTKSKLLNKKENKGKLKQINKAIKDLEAELQEFDDTDPNYVHHNIVNEIEALNNILDLSNSDDPVQFANSLETNKLVERIQDLEDAFSSVKMGDTLINFHKGLDQQKVEALQGRIKNLSDRYHSLSENLIFNIISNNELILQHKQHFEAEGRLDEYEQFIDRVKQLLDPENTDYKIDGDSLFGKNFLGAGSYDSILAEVVLITRDINKSKEAGITNLWRKQLKESYDKIKNIKQGGEYFVDKLFQKDEFGIRTNKLINFATPDYYSKIRIIADAGKQFYLAKMVNKAAAYKDWMTINKMNVDYIQPHKIKSFVEKYKDNPDFNGFFKYSEAEMESYETEMRAKLGDTVFELELENQINSITDYLNDAFLTSKDKEFQNPLAYLENYYSDNFDKSDGQENYYLPKYVKFIPSLEKPDYYNQEFKDVENLGIDGFKDFYHSAKNLLDYTRETARAEGVDVNFNDIISLRDSAGREAKKNLSYFGGLWVDTKAILKNLFSEFYEGRLENVNNDKDYVRKFENHYANYGQREMDNMTKILSRKSLSDLTDIATQEGLTIPDKYKTDTPFTKSKIANSIARNRVNKSISLDLFKRISYGATLAESINTRRSTMGILNVVKDYAKEYNAKNTSDFLNVWEANNILQTGYLNHEKIGKVERTKLGILPKIYTEAEKQLMELYKEEAKNIDGNYDFTDGEFKYYREGDKYYKSKGEDVTEISQSQIEGIYEKFIEGRINELGKNARVGTFMFGLAWNMFRSYLWVSLPSGWKNRMAGYNQNNEAAASNLHGFNMDDLVSARRLLGGTNIRKTINYTGLPKAIGIPATKKAQQIDVLLNLVESLGILENVMQDVDAGDGSGSFIGQDKYNKFKEIMSDFAMNNPEFHNQMEILVAMMQNVELTKVDGTKGKLYDPKTKSFPYDPKTMKLLPEFRTEDNIKNWEQFTVDEAGNAPQNLLIQKYTTVKHKLHGNYRPDDKIGIQSTMTGRGLTAFMKWAYENFNNQYGTKKVSLATAQIDVKGRKIPLFERFPVMATQFIVQNVGISSTGGVVIGAITGTTPIILAGLGVVNAGLVGYLMYKNRKNISLSWQDFGTAFSHLKEIGLRTLKTTMLTTSRGMINPISEERIEKWTNRDRDTYKDRNLDYKTRQLISESAQEVANKLNISIQFMITGLVLKAVYTLLTSSPGDDEEDKLKKLEEIEGKLKFLINTKNQLTSDIEKWTSPTMIYDTYNQAILFRFIKDSYTKVVQSPKKYSEGKISEEDMYYNMIEGISGPLLGTPRQALKVFHPSKSPYSDDRIYDNTQKTWADDYLLNSHLKGEAKFKPLVEAKRRKVRKELEGIYRKKLREEFDKLGRTDYHNMDDIIKKNIDKKLKDSKVYSEKNRTNEKIYNDTDWNEIISSAKENKVDINAAKKKPKKPTSYGTGSKKGLKGGTGKSNKKSSSK